MEKTKIVNARIEQISGGPDIPMFVGEVELKLETGDSYFLSIVDAEGCPTVYRTATSVWDELVESDDDEFFEKMQVNILYESDGYYELFENHDSIECFEGMRYLAYLVRASWEDVEKFIENTRGKDIAKVKVPKSEEEKEMEEGK